jgi:hypothetical protein
MIKLFSTDDFRAAAKDGTSTDGTVFRFATGEAEDVEGATRTKRFVFSDASVDHSNDSIDPKGWDLSVFNRNPVALFSHMSWEPPIGRASNVMVQNDQLVGDIEFASADVYEFADTIYRWSTAVPERGFGRASSPRSGCSAATRTGLMASTSRSSSLLEISVCPVPCNPNALNEARSMGINTARWWIGLKRCSTAATSSSCRRPSSKGCAARPARVEKRYYIRSAPKSLTRKQRSGPRGRQALAERSNRGA